MFLCGAHREQIQSESQRVKHWHIPHMIIPNRNKIHTHTHTRKQPSRILISSGSATKQTDTDRGKEQSEY